MKDPIDIAPVSENPPPELRLYQLRLGRVGNQLHVWALYAEVHECVG